MILKHERAIISQFDGTVIDLETMGHFNSQYTDNERRLSQIIPILFGYLTNAKLTIVYIESLDDLPLILGLAYYAVYLLPFSYLTSGLPCASI
jgi:hypothetical protein